MASAGTSRQAILRDRSILERPGYKSPGLLVCDGVSNQAVASGLKAFFTRCQALRFGDSLDSVPGTAIWRFSDSVPGTAIWRFFDSVPGTAIWRFSDSVPGTAIWRFFGLGARHCDLAILRLGA